MVSLTRLNNTPVLLNSDLIETIESTPDTIVRLTTGQKLMVKDAPELILAKIVDFRRSIARLPGIIDICANEQPVDATTSTPTRVF